MKPYVFLVLSVIGMYAVFTGRAKALLCAITLGADSALQCEQLMNVPLPMQAAKSTFYPNNFGND